ncbi:MAG: maltokinase N-terminal cap-like domain-containing protein [Acidimicrobiales bacterium]
MSPSPRSVGSLPLRGGNEALAQLLGSYLPRQEWARSALAMVGGTQAVPVRVVEVEVLRRGRPGLASVVVDAGETFDHRFHVIVGWRAVPQATASLLRPGAVLGPGEDDEGEVLLYDGLADTELCLELLVAATAGREHASRVRLVHSLASHSALVYDERLFMKCYRVIEPRTRPEIEMMMGLDKVGFNHLLAPVAHWSRSGWDLGLVREFMPGAVEGKALALTSLRDLLARAGTSEHASSFEQVGLAGGDLCYETRRLGETTAELHLAITEAFGTRPGTGPGKATEIRVHGDYHLRRVMRVDAGWLVAGFGDDPLIGAEAGASSQGEPKMASPLEDVADLLVSLDQVAAEAAAIQGESTMAHARVLAAGWVSHNRVSFLRGYLGTEAIARLIPLSREEVEGWLGAQVERRRSLSPGKGGAER